MCSKSKKSNTAEPSAKIGAQGKRPLVCTAAGLFQCMRLRVTCGVVQRAFAVMTSFPSPHSSAARSPLSARVGAVGGGRGGGGGGGAAAAAMAGGGEGGSAGSLRIPVPPRPAVQSKESNAISSVAHLQPTPPLPRAVVHALERYRSSV